MVVARNKITYLHFAALMLASSGLFSQAGVGPAPYCMPAYSNTPCNQPNPSNNAANFINDFNDSFSTSGGATNITNNNTGCNAQVLVGATEDYFFVACPKFLKVNPGQVITCNFLSGIIFDQGFAVFVDWNQDNIFAPAELVCGTPGVPLAATPASANFTVPGAQAAGTYRMRLRCAYFTPGTSIDPCLIYGFGETEDYKLVVGGGGCPVLPIEMTSFECNWKNNAAELKWTTATEINSDYFLIEKSYDGEKFEAIGMVTAMGNSFFTKTYTILDNNIKRKGTTYYRLQEYDKGNNEAKFSKIISLTGNISAGTSFELYPNPASSEMKILMPENLFGKSVTIGTYDTFGRKILSTETFVSSENSSVNLNISELSKGTYFIMVNDNSGTILKKNLIKE